MTVIVAAMSAPWGGGRRGAAADGTYGDALRQSLGDAGFVVQR